MTCATLRRVIILARRALGDDVNLEVDVVLGSCEALYQRAKQLGRTVDSSFGRALRLRRIAARNLQARGLSQYDIAHLLQVDRSSARELLRMPIRSAWMDQGHAPPHSLQPDDILPVTPTRDIRVVTVNQQPDGRWIFFNERIEGTSANLSACVARARRLCDNPDTQVIVEAAAGSELHRICDDALRSTSAAQALDAETYRARLLAARELRDMGIRYSDIGELLDVHVHRVRRLLASALPPGGGEIILGRNG